MQTEQLRYQQEKGWEGGALGTLAAAELVFAFGGRTLLQEQGEALLKQVTAAYPHASVVGCSTAGEIFGTEVSDESFVVCAMKFDHTTIKTGIVTLRSSSESADAGRHAAAAIPHQGLRHVIVLSEGLNINGSELVAALIQNLPRGVTVTGGLAGDADRFQKTLLIDGAATRENAISIVGFYGERFFVSYGSLGGWDTFGTERIVTKSRENILFELDGKPALELYRTYLGEHYEGLPATGLLFPLCIRTQESDTAVVRTILGIDQEKGSITFAGDIPQGAYARLMKANFDRLVDGAIGAANATRSGLKSFTPSVALLISCVGRKIVLKQRVEEEVEGVREILGTTPILTGFYSYGEISPFTPNARCELHNQTMTITAFGEA